MCAILHCIYFWCRLMGLIKTESLTHQNVQENGGYTICESSVKCSLLRELSWNKGEGNSDDGRQ